VGPLFQMRNGRSCTVIFRSSAAFLRALRRGRGRCRGTGVGGPSDREIRELLARTLILWFRKPANISADVSTDGSHLAELAKAVHRSPSRLAHRLREATGVPLRRFILWHRLRAAAEIAMRGSNLTEAAHAAGFADSAHLSRTFRSMFGIAPSFLFSRGQLDVTFLGTALSI